MQPLGHARYLELVPAFTAQPIPVDERAGFATRGGAGANGDARVCIQFSLAARATKDGDAEPARHDAGNWHVR